MFWTDKNLHTEPLRSYRWYVQFTATNFKEIKFALKECKKPEYEINVTEHKLLNHYVRLPGILKWKPITIKFASIRGKDYTLDASSIIYQAAKNGGYSNPFSFLEGALSKYRMHNALETGALNIVQIDADGNNVEVWSLFNAFISSTNFGSLKYESDDIVDIECTINYDYAELNYPTRVENLQIKDKGLSEVSIGTANKNKHNNKLDAYLYSNGERLKIDYPTLERDPVLVLEETKKQQALQEREKALQAAAKKYIEEQEKLDKRRSGILDPNNAADAKKIEENRRKEAERREKLEERRALQQFGKEKAAEEAAAASRIDDALNNATSDSASSVDVSETNAFSATTSGANFGLPNPQGQVEAEPEKQDGSFFFPRGNSSPSPGASLEQEPNSWTQSTQAGFGLQTLSSTGVESIELSDYLSNNSKKIQQYNEEANRQFEEEFDGVEFSSNSTTQEQNFADQSYDIYSGTSLQRENYVQTETPTTNDYGLELGTDLEEALREPVYYGPEAPPEEQTSSYDIYSNTPLEKENYVGLESIPETVDQQADSSVPEPVSYSSETPTEQQVGSYDIYSNTSLEKQNYVEIESIPQTAEQQANSPVPESVYYGPEAPTEEQFEQMRKEQIRRELGFGDISLEGIGGNAAAPITLEGVSTQDVSTESLLSSGPKTNEAAISTGTQRVESSTSFDNVYADANIGSTKPISSATETSTENIGKKQESVLERVYGSEYFFDTRSSGAGGYKSWTESLNNSSTEKLEETQKGLNELDKLLFNQKIKDKPKEGTPLYEQYKYLQKTVREERTLVESIIASRKDDSESYPK